ncbi:nitrite/sulfite reductase [Effusibacillus consociatus]|uniref:Nitrite/sulfite reductase n=1 Tax=Effusibacillus consociatus TaxID=1117041 RepID=A0ABV9Q640_9BACL
MERAWTKDPSKLNKFELYKLEKDGLDILNDLKRFAEQGYEVVTEDDLSLLKWAGVYAQKPKSDGYFMMRVKVPGGIMNSDQARALAGVARDYGRDVIDVTTRQAIQFHWLTVQSLPDIYERLDKVGLTPIEACGDCPRAIIGNPLSGIDPNELLDASPIVEEVHTFFHMNRDFSNLPRKYKISISGNMYNTGHAEINDLAFTPAVKEIDGEEVKGFHVMVGGGLSAKPHLAKKLDIFVRPEEVLKVAIGVTTIFRDHGYREKRHHARLKFLVADWGPEKFREELLKLTGPLPTQGKDMTLGWSASYFYGVHKQKQPGLNYVGLSVPVGRLYTEEMEELARLADKYGNGSIRTCNSQNLILANIPDEKVNELLEEQLLKRLTPFPKPFMAYAVSCTGNEYCNLALVETKERMRSVAEYLDQHVALDTPIRLHMIGCPNSCGQQQIADIGMQGSLTKVNGEMVEAYDLAVGGILGPDAQFNTKLKGRVPADKLPNAIAHLVKFYKESRQEGESFHSFVKRLGVSAFQEKLEEFLAVTV